MKMLEIKNMIPGIKKLLDGFKSKLRKAEEKSSEFEERLIACNQTEIQRKKAELKKN